MSFLSQTPPPLAFQSPIHRRLLSLNLEGYSHPDPFTWSHAKQWTRYVPCRLGYSWISNNSKWHTASTTGAIDMALIDRNLTVCNKCFQLLGPMDTYNSLVTNKPHWTRPEFMFLESWKSLYCPRCLCQGETRDQSLLARWKRTERQIRFAQRLCMPYFDYVALYRRQGPVSGYLATETHLSLFRGWESYLPNAGGSQGSSSSSRSVHETSSP